LNFIGTMGKLTIVWSIDSAADFNASRISVPTLHEAVTSRTKKSCKVH